MKLEGVGELQCGRAPHTSTLFNTLVHMYRIDIVHVRTYVCIIHVVVLYVHVVFRHC